MTFVSPYNDLAIIGGQGTLGLELLEQVDDLETVFVAVGGGGLASGVAGILKALSPSVRVIGCSPANSAVMYHSLRAGQILDMPSDPTLSDGTAGGVEPGAITFGLLEELLDDFVTVEEDEIRAAFLELIEIEHLLVEGSAAMAYAAARACAAARAIHGSDQGHDRRHPLRWQHRCREAADHPGLMGIVGRARIEEVLVGLDLLPLIEAAFVGYSAGRAIVPPVGELLLDKGEVHIKYGAIAGDDYYVIKVASGFYQNPSLGLPSELGAVLARAAAGRTAADQITVFDSTGVAVQDIAIATAVVEAIEAQEG